VAIEVISGDALAARLADPEWCEAPVTDAISPLTVVELTTPVATTLPAALPRFVVAVGAPAPALDAAVTDTDALNELARAAAANPRAVITLVQLLRTSSTLTVEEALVAESLAYSALLAGDEFQRWKNAQPPRAHHDDPEPVLVGRARDRVTITLHRPAVHNAYDAAMRDALIDVLRPLAALDSPPEIELRGDGPSFSSGGDLSEFGTNTDASFAHLVRTARAPGALLHRLAAVTTARVHGSCVGAGVELPAYCGHVEAHADATFRLPEIAMGLVPGAGGTVSLPRRIGRQHTAELAVSGRTIDASAACAWGLVDCVV
jgi:enoyl-CoA hydratase/carnithine racemase